ncbi:Uncharacterized protein HZ326_3719 [Fusarium oxysporum f. sp. albedinis]|nr:Uncharacterized protein HZ326_3719 [Fusarium oxysporum f. sp. albedinis]
MQRQAQTHPFCAPLTLFFLFWQKDSGKLHRRCLPYKFGKRELERSGFSPCFLRSTSPFLYPDQALGILNLGL